jgi:uncharacterized membrane protein YraQ (UPF0718 family)
LVSALKFSWFLAKQILPYFIVGLVIVSYVEACLSQELVTGYLTGITGVLLASVVGGSLYTPTLVEIVLGRSLLQARHVEGGVAFVVYGPALRHSKHGSGLKDHALESRVDYAFIAWACSLVFGLLYGVVIGSL